VGARAFGAGPLRPPLLGAPRPRGGGCSAPLLRMPAWSLPRGVPLASASWSAPAARRTQDPVPLLRGKGFVPYPSTPLPLPLPVPVPPPGAQPWAHCCSSWLGPAPPSKRCLRSKAPPRACILCFAHLPPPLPLAPQRVLPSLSPFATPSSPLTTPDVHLIWNDAPPAPSRATPGAHPQARPQARPLVHPRHPLRAPQAPPLPIVLPGAGG